MSFPHRWLPAIALAVSPVVVAAGNYIGVLRPTATPAALAIPEPGFYWPMAGPFDGGLGADAALDRIKLKLGYRHSNFFSVEAGYADFGRRAPGAAFAVLPARGRGFSLETVGTLPLWTRAALYGRFGAWRLDGGASLFPGAESSVRPGAGLRYGLGLKVDLTRRVGLQAELEHFSAFDRWRARESEADQVTLGVTWRF